MDRDKLSQSAVGALCLGGLNVVTLGLYAAVVAPWFATGYGSDATIGLFMLAFWAFCALTANIYVGLTIVEDGE